MKYTGKLYGRIYGKTFETGHTGAEFIAMESRIHAIDRAIELIQKARSNNGNDAMLQDAIISLLPPKP
jgi:hypothetical protein